MIRSVLRLMTKSFSKVLSDRLPPSGKPVMVLFEARAVTLIDTLPVGCGPDVGTDLDKLDTEKVRRGLDWLFATLTDAYSGDDWCRAFCQLGRLYGEEHAQEVLDGVAAPSRSLNGGGEPRKAP